MNCATFRACKDCFRRQSCGWGVAVSLFRECINTHVRDKQALRLSSGSSHVETQNFASDIVICIHFYRHCPSEMQNFAPLHVADSRPEACIPFRTNENPYLELAYIVSFPHSSSAYALLSASCIPPCLGAARYAFGLPKISLSDSNA